MRPSVPGVGKIAEDFGRPVDTGGANIAAKIGWRLAATGFGRIPQLGCVVYRQGAETVQLKMLVQRLPEVGTLLDARVVFAAGTVAPGIFLGLHVNSF